MKVLTDQDFDVSRGLKEIVKAHEFREVFPTFFRNAPAGTVKWPSSKLFEQLDTSIDKLKSSHKTVAQGRCAKAVPTSQA